MSKKKITLALQGGGAHGAYTWGIVERLLELPDIEITGICGTSAGAMNATAIAYGLSIGGAEGAKKILKQFWEKISQAGKFSPLQPSWVDRWLSPGNMDYSPGYFFFKLMTEVFSPYEFNPLDYNPLKDILNQCIDFQALRRFSEPHLFVCATNVKTCRSKVFRRPEIKVESLLASACLPFLFKAVEIEGEYYWDGGYTGNPPIFPLVEGCPDTSDILLVKINPIVIQKVPKTVIEIQDRVNEISFNSSLMLEMRLFNLKRRMLEMGIDLNGRLRPIHFHAIHADSLIHYSLSSKLNTTMDFLYELKKSGRKIAEEWIQENWESVGTKSTCDIEKTFL